MIGMIYSGSFDHFLFFSGLMAIISIDVFMYLSKVNKYDIPQ
jgi:hypothetical protein